MKRPKGKYAWSVKVGERGQIVLPKEARELFQIQPGDTLLLLGDEHQGIAIPPRGLLQMLTTHMFGGSPQETEEEDE